MKTANCTRRFPDKAKVFASKCSTSRYLLMLIIWLVTSGSLVARNRENKVLSLQDQWNGQQIPPSNKFLPAGSNQKECIAALRIGQNNVQRKTVFIETVNTGNQTTGTYNWPSSGEAENNSSVVEWTGLTVQMDTRANHGHIIGPDSSISISNSDLGYGSPEDEGYLYSCDNFIDSDIPQLNLQEFWVPSGISAGQSVTVNMMFSLAHSAGELIHLRHISNALVSACQIAVQTSTSAGKPKNHHQPECSAAHYYALTPRLPTPPAISAS